MLKEAAYRSLEWINAVPILGRKLDQFSIAYHRARENCSYDLRRNGEAWLLRRLAAVNTLGQVFDVGANRGDWAALVLEANPAAHLHCFEICPPTYQRLAARFAGNPRVTAHPFGLSDTAGEIVINHCLDTDVLTSMFEVVCSKNNQATAAQVRRGADFLGERGITRIDLLKIDVEGAEHLVLRGFEGCISPTRVPVVQFEYGTVNILTRYLLKDFYAYFEERGYRVGKLFPRRVRFRPYRLEDEDFLGPNYVAVAPELVARLEGS